MKRTLMSLALVAGTLFLATPAQATTPPAGDEPCTEQVLDHEAYDETVTVTEAVPGQDEVVEVSHIVTHPAETKIVHHDAVTQTEYHFAKFTRERTRKGNAEWSAYGPWSKYSPETHTSWETSSTPIGSPQFHSEGTRAGGIKWERQWQAMADGQTRTTTIKDGYDETVTVKDAYEEKVIDVAHKPAVPAQDAVTKVVHHEATYKTVEVACPPPVYVPQEKPVCWQVITEGQLFPQKLISETLCGTPAPKCEDVTYQEDVYDLTSTEDEATYDALISSGVLNGSHEDGSLDPAPYRVFTVDGDAALCSPPVEEPPVVVPPVTPPVVTPPSIVPPVVTPPVERIGTPIKVEAPKPTPKAYAPPASTQVLPNTGAPENLRAGALGALAFVLAGVALVVGAARRRAH